jgi:hypothetical protein
MKRFKFPLIVLITHGGLAVFGYVYKENFPFGAGIVLGGFWLYGWALWQGTKM